MSIFEQPDIRSYTKTGGMMRKINLTLTGMLAVLAFVFTLGAGPIHAQTFPMPPCPIKTTTVPPTKTEITLPSENPLGETFSFQGTVQVSDQTSSTVFLMEYYYPVDPSDPTKGVGPVIVDSHGINFARTVKTIGHSTFSLAFDKGCTKTDPYGSNNCHWDWGQTITESYQGALQEDITAGKIIVDLKVDNTIPVQFAGPVCGTDFTITVPEQDQNGRSTRRMWELMSWFTRLPLSLTTPLSLAVRMLSAFQVPANE